MNRLALIIPVIVLLLAVVAGKFEHSRARALEPVDAAKIGDVALLQERIQSGSVDVNYRYHASHHLGGKTLLHYACEHLQPEAARLLIQSGADVNVQDNEEYTPLMTLLNCDGTVDRKLIVLDILLKAKPNLALQRSYGGWYTDHILCMAASQGNAAFVARLLAAGAPVDLQSSCNDWTPLHEICARPDRSESLTIIRLLLDAGADTTIKDGWRRTPLQTAVKHNHLDAAELLRNWKGNAVKANE